MIGLIVAALAGFAIGAIVVLVILKWKDILNWFRNRQKLKESDKANIAFTLQERLGNGDYKTVQGIFNKRSNEVLDAEQSQSKKVDEELSRHHRDNELVVYE